MQHKMNIENDQFNFSRRDRKFYAFLCVALLRLLISPKERTKFIYVYKFIVVQCYYIKYVALTNWPESTQPRCNETLFPSLSDAFFI